MNLFEGRFQIVRCATTILSSDSLDEAYRLARELVTDHEKLDIRDTMVDDGDDIIGSIRGRALRGIHGVVYGRHNEAA